MKDSSQSALNVLIVEDNLNYKKIVCQALNDTIDLHPCGSYSSCEAALKHLIDSKQEQPEVILLDLELPGIGGLDAIPKILSIRPSVRIIVLTRSDNESNILPAITQGAAGYLLKSSGFDKIEESIRDVGKGGASLDPRIAHYVLQALKTIPTKTEEEPILSPRQIEVLQLLSEGLVKKEIAEKLDLSYHTVVMHVRHIYNKLQVQNISAAVTKAIKKGII